MTNPRFQYPQFFMIRKMGTTAKKSFLRVPPFALDPSYSTPQKQVILGGGKDPRQGRLLLQSSIIKNEKERPAPLIVNPTLEVSHSPWLLGFRYLSVFVPDLKFTSARSELSLAANSSWSGIDEDRGKIAGSLEDRRTKHLPLTPDNKSQV